MRTATPALSPTSSTRSQPPHRPRIALLALGWAAGAVALGGCLAGPWLVLGARVPLPDPEPISDRLQLERAVAEARENCLAAAALDDDADGVDLGGPLFSTRELILALRTRAVVAQAYGELEAMEREARWLATLRAESSPAPRTWEDVRFLLGCLHWYVSQARAALEPPCAPRTYAHPAGPAAYDRQKLKVYRGLSFEGLLGLWD